MKTRRITDDAEYLDESVPSEILMMGNVGHPERSPGPVRRAPAESSSPEERITMFWRIFGGTIMTIIALALIAVYNNLTSTINDLRNEMSRANEARVELVKKDEFNTRTQSVWNKVQEVQELRGMLNGLKDQVAGMAENRSEQKSMIERLSNFEQRLKSAEEQQKTLVQIQGMMTALEQKITVRDGQAKSLEDDRKEVGKQILELRERLAKLETLIDFKPMPKIPAAKD